jgi:NitT/TauT family transport system substrate-binding protein
VPLTKIRLLYQPVMSFLPLLIAQDEGFFREQGLDVELVTSRRGLEALPLLVQGDVDVFVGTVSSAIFNSIAQGAHIRIVADRGQAVAGKPTYIAFVARKALVEAGTLESPANWKGLRFDTNPDPEIKNFLLARLLEQAGLTAADVQVTSVLTPADCEALRAGSIDVTVHTEPFVTKMVQDGYGVIWKTAEEIYPDFQTSFMIYSSRLLLRERETGQRFMNAYFKGVRQYHQGKTERNLDIAARHTELDREVLRAAGWPTIREDGRINVQSLVDFQVWAAREKGIDRCVPPEEFWDPGFVEHAAAAPSAPR